MPKNASQDFASIRAQLKACDKDSYLSALFVGGKDTESLWTLYAFHCELAKISSIVQEPMLGKMRLQWWRDVVRGAYETPQTLSGHPVADQLSVMIARYQLKDTFFYQIIDARERDLEAQFFTSQQDFEEYHNAIWGNLYRLSYHIMGQGDETDFDMTLLDDPIFNAVGSVTAMIKFLSYGDFAALKSHLEMSLGQDNISVSLEQIAQNQDFQTYKQEQIGLIYQKLDLILQRLTALPRFNDRVFLSLALVSDALSRWEKEQQAFNIPQNIKPLKQFWLLWRGSHKGLRMILKNNSLVLKYSHITRKPEKLG